MEFRKFLKVSEEQSSGDSGLMGYGKSSSVHKPSDGYPFANLSSVAGQEPKGGGSPMTGGSAPMMGGNEAFMRKKMRKKMHKKMHKKMRKKMNK